MFKHTLLLAFALSGAIDTPLFAQQFSITYQNPDQLAVCSADTLRVTVQNNMASSVPAAFLDVELPPGLEYEAGSAAGAAEFDISNPAKPVLQMPALAPGAAVSLQLKLYASCGLVEAINSAQLFQILLRVRAGAVSEQLSTSAFQIQTSLLVITQVDNDSISGEKGDVLIRTLHVQNTRLGAVKHLYVRDSFPAGYFTLQMPGSTNEQFTGNYYTAYFDSSFFKNFGDGDALLEFGETALVQEFITITACPDNPETVRSKLIADWSCTAMEPPCQGDSTYADVVILPWSKAPKLALYGNYPLGWDRCAQIPSTGTLQLVNSGLSPSDEVLITLTTYLLNLNTGIDPNSLRYFHQGKMTPIVPSIVDTVELPECGVTYAKNLGFYLPGVGPEDTLNIYFEVYYCSEACKPEIPDFRASFIAGGDCAFQGGSVGLTQREVDNLLADVYYDIQTCLKNGETYDFHYVVQSERLLADTGFLWLTLDLPHGLFWSTACPAPQIGGKTPVVFTIDSVYSGYPVQRVQLAFELPLSSDSLSMPFCLRSTCSDDAVFVPQNGIDGPDSTGYFVAQQTLPGDHCGHCGFPVHAEAKLSRFLNSNLDCAWPRCDDFRLRTECDRPDCGADAPVNPDSCPVLREHHQALRINYGLPDSDDDRHADAAGSLDLSKIRRDRLIAGDTLEAVLSTKIVCGDSIRDFFYQLFTETARTDIGFANTLDSFEIGPKLSNTGRQHIANRDSFQVIEAIFTVWDSSSNKVYSCPINPAAGGTDKYFGLIAPVNVKPPPPVDLLATMSYVFRPDLGELANAGCIPPGLILESGDSVALKVHYKLAFNFVPYSPQHRPPLINFELGFNANQPEEIYNYRRFDTLMFQYSGVWDSISHPQYSIKACEPSTGLTPFSYTARIARENLFPFEVRPLNAITSYALTVPAGAALLSSELEFLNLQENVPVLQNFPLPYTIANDTLEIDFSPAYASPPDEGYFLRTRTVFAPNCKFDRPKGSRQFVVLDWTGCIEMPDPDTVKSENLVGFLANAARDTMTTDELVIDFPTPEEYAEVFIKNKAPVAAPNYWIEFFNPEGGLSNFAVQFVPSGPVLYPVNGVVQLGTLPSLGNWTLRVSAYNNTCEPQHLQVIYGWDCAPHTQAGQSSCTRRVLEFLFRPLNPEIELELQQIPASIPLCDSSEYLVFEVSNADLGYAYKPFATLELPAGFLLVPGSCQLAYPSGSAFLPIPDPAVLSGNILEWNLANLQPAVASGGLPGVNLKPDNGMQIRFKVLADCGVISNTQLIFGARAEWSCGKPTNTLRKASDPLPVEGVIPAYSTQISIAEPGGSKPAYCHTEHVISVNMQLSGPAQAGDSIYATLPAGYTYVTGSYQPGANAPAGPPQVQNNILRWPLPGGLPPASIIQFSFSVLSGGMPNCNGAFLQVQTRQHNTAFCPLTQANCTVYVASGEASFTFSPVEPDLKILSAVLGNDPFGLFNLSVDFQNLSPFPVAAPVFQLYADVDGNGVLSAADMLIKTVTGSNPAPAGSLQTLVFADLQLPAPVCRFLLVLKAEDNCACADVVFPFNNGDISYATKTICLGQSALIGISSQTGHQYQWSGFPGFSCDTCSQILFTPDAGGLYQLTLSDQGGICAIDHHFEIIVNLPAVLLSADTSICPGQSVTLQTSPAANWSWTGPDNVHSTGPVLTVQPAQTGIYSVVATTAAGCTLSASVTVTILPSDTTDLGILRTCQGTPVDIFGAPTDQPGTYRKVLTNAAGCDSTLVLTLEVIPNTEEAAQRCPDTTLIVFGEPVSAAGTYCKTFVSSLGCDSMHCVMVTDLPGPVLPDPDTFYVELGSSVQLPSPGDFASYFWTPSAFLNCTSCPSPVSTPPDTINYVVTVATDLGCSDSLNYYVIPRAPCDPADIRIPNAFTPNGDQDNDVFTLFPFEGSPTVERLQIYNRWGQKIYDGSGPNAAWDGTTNGKPAPVDVYVWIMEVHCAGDERGVLHGDVSLLR